MLFVVLVKLKLKQALPSIMMIRKLPWKVAQERWTKAKALLQEAKEEVKSAMTN